LSVPRLSLRRRLSQLPPPSLRFHSWRLLRRPTSRVSKAVYSRTPTRLLSRLWGLLNELRLPRWLRWPLLAAFVWAFSVNMEEAEDEDLNHYQNLGELFRRPLKATARPIASHSVVRFRPIPRSIPQCMYVLYVYLYSAINVHSASPQ
ncbi:hypothetical protein FKM82_027134, partial [Ascaphus truei]